MAPDIGSDPRIVRAIRPILFETDLEDFRYATHGGTIFVVVYKGRPYGITCRHCFGDFDLDNLVVTGRDFAQVGDRPADIATFCMPSREGEPAGTDIDDLCVVIFADHISASFFEGTAYSVQEDTVAASKRGHKLFIPGYLKDKLEIAPPAIRLGRASLNMLDDGPAGFDPFLRRATARFGSVRFDTITGLSGAPVYDRTQEALVGVVARGMLTPQECLIYFIDFTDVLQLLNMAHVRGDRLTYEKAARSE